VVLIVVKNENPALPRRSFDKFYCSMQHMFYSFGWGLQHLFMSCKVTKGELFKTYLHTKIQIWEYRNRKELLFTTIHYYSLLFTTIHYYSLLFTTIHYYPQILTTIHYYSLLSTTIHYYSLLFTTTHYYPLIFTSIHYYSLLFTTIPYYSLLITTNHFYSLLFTFKIALVSDLMAIFRIFLPACKMIHWTCVSWSFGLFTLKRCGITLFDLHQHKKSHFESIFSTFKHCFSIFLRVLLVSEPYRRIINV
jgi:hypothetical protein